MKCIELGKRLIENNAISPDENEVALQLQKHCGCLLGDILVGEGYVKRQKLYHTIAEQYDLPFVDLMKSPPDNTLILKEDLVYYTLYGYIPQAYENGHYIIATPNISNELKKWADGRYIDYEFVITSPNDIRWTIEEFFGDHNSHLAREELHNEAPHFSAKYLTYWFLALFIPLLFLDNLLLHAVIAINILYITTFVFKGLIFGVGLPATKEEKLDIDPAKLPIYTILIPLYNEHKSLPHLTQNLRNLDYPKSKLDIKLIIEEDDKLTLQTAKDLNLECYFEIIKVPHSAPKTKPKACNYALKFARGKYVTIYDAEDNPDQLQLKKAVAKFSKTDAVCLQARLNYYNAKHNLLTKLFSVEYSSWFEYMLQGLERLGFPIPLGGTSNHIRLDILREVGAWDPYNVTEDADLGIRLEQAGYTTAMLNSETQEEAPHTIWVWMKQRTRWIKGYMQTYLVHMRNPLKLLRNLGLRKFIGFQCFIGLPTLMFLVTPFMLILSGFWFSSFLPIKVPSWVLYLCFINIIVGVGIHWIFGMIVYCANPPERKSISAVFVFPFYWLLHSLAAFRAVYQLITRPHYWDKTEHGFWNKPTE